jgi:hypothetical protein
MACPGTSRTDGGDHLYLDDTNCAVTHVNGTSGPREPSRQHESRLLIRAGDDSHWMDGTHRSASDPRTYRVWAAA